MELTLSRTSLQNGYPIEKTRRIAIIGAGGKTSLAQDLAEDELDQHRNVVFTTTTHLAKHEVIGALESDFPADLSGVVTVAREDEKNKKKLTNPDETVLSRVLREINDRIIVEADGARGRLLKVHRSFEPVIPEPIDAVTMVINLNSIGRKARDEVVHTRDRWEEVIGKTSSIQPRNIERLILKSSGYRVPDHLQQIVTFVISRQKFETINSILKQFSEEFWGRFNDYLVKSGKKLYRV
ncbi:MAG: selenium cofactor biosynthesis protein YqeC, partial [bacterium]